MKLNPTHVAQTLSQYEAEPIPENHPVLPELNRLFGDHTFFLDGQGLHIVEPVAPTQPGAHEAKVVRLASWSDAGRTSLAAHEPEPTEVVVDLGSEKLD